MTEKPTILTLRITKEEKKLLEKQAEGNFDTVSNYVRRKLFSPSTNTDNKNLNLCLSDIENLIKEKMDKNITISAKMFSLLLEIATKNNLTKEEITKSIKKADELLLGLK